MTLERRSEYHDGSFRVRVAQPGDDQPQEVVVHKSDCSGKVKQCKDCPNPTCLHWYDFLTDDQRQQEQSQDAADVATACGREPELATCTDCWYSGDDTDCISRHSCFSRLIHSGRLVVVPAGGIPASAYES